MNRAAWRAVWPEEPATAQRARGAVIAGAVHATGADGSAADVDAVLVLDEFHAQRFQAARHHRQAVAFFDPQLGRAAQARGTLGPRGQREDHRQLVDQAGHPCCRDVDPLQAARVADAQVGDLLAAGFPRLADFEVGAHGLEHAEDAVAGGVDAHVVQHQVGTGHQRSRDQEERRRGDIGRHPQRGAAQARTALHRPVAGQGHAERGQHVLGVVAAEQRLPHRGHAVRVEAGQQQAGFHLRAGHRRFVADALQPVAAVDPERWRAAFGCLDLRAHLPQRNSNALHWAAGQGIVTGQHGIEWHAGQKTGQWGAVRVLPGSSTT